MPRKAKKSSNHGDEKLDLEQYTEALKGLLDKVRGENAILTVSPELRKGFLEQFAALSRVDFYRLVNRLVARGAVKKIDTGRGKPLVLEFQSGKGPTRQAGRTNQGRAVTGGRRLFADLLRDCDLRISRWEVKIDKLKRQIAEEKHLRAVLEQRANSLR